MAAAHAAGTMKHIILSLSLMSLFACGSKKGDPSNCEDVYNHTMSLIPDGLKAKMESGKAEAIAKCEKMPIEARQCALDASSMEDLMKCKK